MISTTTQWIEGTQVDRYLGIVTAEIIFGMNALRDAVADLKDFFGGRARGYEEGLAEARRLAIQRLETRSQELGGNAVVGVTISYTPMGQTHQMLMVCAAGTAVLVSRPAPKG